MEIKRNANRAAVLVRQLLAFSRKQTMRPTVLNLTDVVGDLRMLVDRLLSGTNVKLDVDYGRDLWPVKTDLSQFEQVLINLCVNARDAMPDGGTLTLRTRNLTAAEVAALQLFATCRTRTMVLVEVADTGTGHRARDHGQDLRALLHDQGSGQGHRAWPCHGLRHHQAVRRLHLTRNPKSARVRPSASSCRAISPKRPSPAEAEALSAARAGTGRAARPQPAGAAGGPDRQSAVVLLVEDEEAVRRGGKRMLETRGYTVHEAGSGVEALDIMEELDGKVDIVVSDVVMPEMDGPTLLRELRKNYPDLKFIFVSGYAEDAFARNLPAGRQVRLPAEALLAEAACRRRQGNAR